MIFNNLKHSINDILNKPFLSLIMIIQMSIGLLFFYNGTKIIISNIDKVKLIKNAFEVNQIYRIEDLSDQESLLEVKKLEDDFVDRMNKFEKELQNAEDFYCVRLNNNPISIEKFDGCEEFANFNIINEKLDGKEFSCVNAVNGDKNYFRTFKFEVEEGRYFTDKDFVRSPNIPIILGNDYKGKFEIGDKIASINSDSGKIIELEVIGFLKKGCYFFQKTLAPEGVFRTDNFILVPMYDLNQISNIEEADEEISRYYDTMIISNTNKKQLLSEINKKIEGLNLFDFNLINGEELIKEAQNYCNYQIKIVLSLFGVLSLFTSINIITSIINYFMKKKREFAIHIMCGASNIDLILRIIFQNVVIFTTSYLVMMIINNFLNKKSNSIWYDSRMLIITAILCIALISINSLIPIIKIFKMNLNKTLKEE